MYQLIDTMSRGGVIVYPTETLYALGCDAMVETACKRVSAIKARQESKPLPLIIGGFDMLSLVTGHISTDIKNLAEAFWPGPLSILVKALPELPDAVSDAEGFTSVRFSAHPFAAELSRRLKRPLVATSANMSGKEPVSMPEDIDPEVLEMTDGAYFDPPWPRGGEPSTVIRIKESTRLTVIREGAISIKKLCDKGYSVSIGK